MKNDHTYEYRVFTNRLVDVGPMEVGNCTRKVIDNLKSKDKVDGRFFHTSDSNEWFFCWNGELQELNLSGDADVNSALAEVEKLIADAKVAVEDAKKTASEAKDVAASAKDAADAATSAVESIENKADQKEVDAITQTVESLEQEVKDKANQTAVNDLAQEVKDKANISDLDNKADRSELEGLATESYVVTKIAEAKLEGSDITIPVQDVKVNGQTVVKDMIANIDLTPYAKSEDVPSIKGLATEQWVTEKNYLTQHQDISHLASTTYVNDELAKKQDVIDDLDKIISDAAAVAETNANSYTNRKFDESIADAANKYQPIGQYASKTEIGNLATKQEVVDVVDSTKDWVNQQGFLTEETLKNSTVISDINSQISEINTLLGDVKSYIKDTILA